MRLIKNKVFCILAIDIYNVGFGGVHGAMLADRVLPYIFKPPITIILFILAFFCEKSAERFLRNWFDGGLKDPLNP